MFQTKEEAFSIKCQNVSSGNKKTKSKILFAENFTSTLSVKKA